MYLIMKQNSEVKSYSFIKYNIYRSNGIMKLTTYIKFFHIEFGIIYLRSD